jgi:hypothetical protein
MKLATPDQIECPALREFAAAADEYWMAHADDLTMEYLAQVRAGCNNDHELAEQILSGIVAATRSRTPAYMTPDERLGFVLLVTAFEIEIESDITGEVLCTKWMRPQ